MADLVVRHDALFLVVQNLVLLLRTGQDGVHGLLQVVLGHGLAVVAYGAQRGFVDDVGQLSAGSTGGHAGHNGKVAVGTNLDLFGVQAQDALAPLEVRQLDRHAKKVRLGPDCDFSVVARMTPGASGAELANIVNEAALCAVRHRRKAVTQFDLQEAVDTILAGAQKKNKILNNKEKCIVSYHEVGHALVAALQTNSAPVQKITIVPRTSGALGFTMQVEDGDHTLMTKEEILNKIATLTGGRAAEELIFHSITTGASNDIEQATKLARALVTRYGMTEDFDMVALETVNNAYLGGDASLACSEQTAAKVDAKVVEIVQAEHRKAYKLLADNKRKLDEIAQYLYEKETISGEEFMRILNAQPQLPAGTSADSTNAVQ